MRGGVSVRGTVDSLPQRYGHSRDYVLGSRRGVIAMYGDTGTRDSWYALDDAIPYFPMLHGNGFPTASCDTGVLWGNSTLRTNMSTLRTNLQTAGVFASGKVHLLGISAGGLAALNWLKANPTLAASALIVIPALNPQGIYDDPRGAGFKAEITAAFGGRPPDSECPFADPASYAGICPIRIYYSTDDTVTFASEILSFASGSGAVAVSMGAVGHFWGAPFSEQAIAGFFGDVEEGTIT